MRVKIKDLGVGGIVEVYAEEGKVRARWKSGFMPTPTMGILDPVKFASGYFRDSSPTRPKWAAYRKEVGEAILVVWDWIQEKERSA